jgi:hypothetical protein
MAHRPSLIEIAYSLNSRSVNMTALAARIVPALSNSRLAPIQINNRATGGSQ